MPPPLYIYLLLKFVKSGEQMVRVVEMRPLSLLHEINMSVDIRARRKFTGTECKGRFICILLIIIRST